MQSYLWYFFAYSFLGWCAEVVFAALKNGRFVNRGFLNGPWCPIYGSGLVAVLYLLLPFQQNLLLLYLGSVVLTTAIEFVTGLGMEKLFHQRWWDYSKMPLNIGGYVCPLFSLIWGVACVLIVDVLHPRIAALIQLIPSPWSLVLLCVLGGVFIVDICVTVGTVTRLNRRLTQIDDLATALRLVSDRLGMTMTDGALAVKATDDRVCDELVSAKEQVRKALFAADEQSRAELKARYADLIEKLDRGQRRLLKAFPAIRSIRYPAALNDVKEKLSRLWESKYFRR